MTTPSLPAVAALAAALTLSLTACSKDGDDTGAGDGGGGQAGDAGWSGGAPSTGQEYFQAFGYEACRLQAECAPESTQYYSYEQCIDDVDLATQYYDAAMVDCTFDAALAADCWDIISELDCAGYEGGENACADEIWECP